MTDQHTQSTDESVKNTAPKAGTEETTKTEQESQATDTQPAKTPGDDILSDTGDAHWYVIHTYSGYEESVKRNLLQRVETLGMEEYIFDIMVPTENKVKIKNGKRKQVVEKIFPGYVFVRMLITDASWYAVRNTPNVTGFVGTGNLPSPIAETEIADLKQRMGAVDSVFHLDAIVGDVVKVTDGPFKDHEGKIDIIDEARGKVKVLVSLFGRETPLEVDFLQVKKI